MCPSPEEINTYINTHIPTHPGELVTLPGPLGGKWQSWTSPAFNYKVSSLYTVYIENNNSITCIFSTEGGDSPNFHMTLKTSGLVKAVEGGSWGRGNICIADRDLNKCKFEEIKPHD